MQPLSHCCVTACLETTVSCMHVIVLLMLCSTQLLNCASAVCQEDRPGRPTSCILFNLFPGAQPSACLYHLLWGAVQGPLPVKWLGHQYTAWQLQRKLACQLRPYSVTFDFVCSDQHREKLAYCEVRLQPGKRSVETQPAHHRASLGAVPARDNRKRRSKFVDTVRHRAGLQAHHSTSSDQQT